MFQIRCCQSKQQVRDAGERRHPGAFLVEVRKPSGFQLPPEDRIEIRLSVDEFRIFGWS